MPIPHGSGSGLLLLQQVFTCSARQAATVASYASVAHSRDAWRIGEKKNNKTSNNGAVRRFGDLLQFPSPPSLKLLVGCNQSSKVSTNITNRWLYSRRPFVACASSSALSLLSRCQQQLPDFSTMTTTRERERDSLSPSFSFPLSPPVAKKQQSKFEGGEETKIGQLQAKVHREDFSLALTVSVAMSTTVAQIKKNKKDGRPETILHPQQQTTATATS